MLNSTVKRELRARAHALKPVVAVGQRGVTDSVVAAVEQALHDHELVKIRLRSMAREERDALAAQLCGALSAELVSLVGGVATLFRPRPEARKKAGSGPAR